MAETQAYAVPDLTLATTYTNPAMLPDMGVQQTQLDQLFSQNPVSMPVNDVIAAIQSQYQQQPVNYGDGPYGAARFIDGSATDLGLAAPVTAPWFKPGAFDINAYGNTPSQDLAQKISTGELYGGDGYSPIDTGGNVASQDPYGAWGLNIPGVAKGFLNSMIPGAGLALGAAQGYAQTQLGNTIGTGLSAYGGQTNQTSPTLGAVLGMLGISNPSSALAQQMGKNFSSAETMYGYMDAASNPAVSQITEALLGRAGTPSAVTPEMVGVIGYAVSSQVQGMIGSGASVGEAVAQVAENMGISPGDASAMGVTAAQAAVESAIASGTPLSDLNPVDVQAYNDPIGGLISQLGLSTDTQSPTSNAPDNIDVGGGWSPAADSGSSYGGVDNTGAAMSASDADVAYGADQYGGSETQSSGDSGGGGSSKIVCTAMNEAYGFGSFRNQIWLKYSADRMTKAHEVGYHTLFLPLVDLGYTKDVKVVRKVLEHIARHRTADLRAEMRGTKRDNLGRMYRFVLEPLCYVVGKLKGY